VIHLVDQAMERFLRAEVPLTEDVADVSFKTPDKTWSAGVNRPTLNLFLYDVHKDVRFTTAGRAERRNAGDVERRQSAPVIDLRYVVTAWAAEPRDEHQVLGNALRCVLAHGVVPEAYLGDGLSARAGYLVLAVGTENRKAGDVAPALDGRVRASFELEIAVPVDAFDWTAAGPPTEAVEVAVQRLPPPPRNATSKEAPTTRRRRQNGALVMEGRPDDA
jgi:hypothetical protein